MAPFSMVEFIPMRQLSSIVAPCTIAPCPIETYDPILSGWFLEECKTQLS